MSASLDHADPAVAQAGLRDELRDLRRQRLRGGLQPSVTTSTTTTAAAAVLPPASAAAVAAAADQRAAELREQLERAWRQVVRHWPAARRLRWLEDQATALLMKPRHQLARLRDCARERVRLGRSVPSATWFDDAWSGGARFPVPGMTLSTMTVVLESSRVRDDGTPLTDRFAGRRWQSPLAAAAEDALDELTPQEALRYRHPPSCSAVAIERIRTLRATERGGGGAGASGNGRTPTARGGGRRRRLIPFSFTIGGETVVGFA
jgi:hypothetical protein